MLTRKTKEKPTINLALLPDQVRQLRRLFRSGKKAAVRDFLDQFSGTYAACLALGAGLTKDDLDQLYPYKADFSVRDELAKFDLDAEPTLFIGQT